MSSKKDIIRKGVELFRQQGYNNTGIQDILDTCDISKGSFYNYFRSKEDYAIIVVDYYGDSLLEFMTSKLKIRGDSPLDRLKDLYLAFIDMAEREDIKSGCLVNNISNEMGGLNEKLAEAANRNFDKWTDTLAQIVAKAQTAHEIRNDKGALEIAEYIHGTFFGMLSRMKATRETDELREWHKMTFDFLSA